MIAVTDDAEYLDEVREQICGRCFDRRPGPDCGGCGVERWLPELVESVHAAGEYNDLDPALWARVVGAVGAVDERRRQWELVRRRAARRSRKERAPVAEMIQAYEAE